MPRLAYFEPVPYRVRGVRERQVVVDSERAHYARGADLPFPVFCFPREDVRVDALPAGAVRDHEREGFVTVDWEAVTEWFGEDEQLFGHVRDPYHRIDVLKSTRHVRVLHEGEVLADTRRASILYETALPPRYYMPIEDVRAELVPSPTKTRCAYKGSASYYSVRVGDRLLDDLVWTYPLPQNDAVPVRDLVCFFNERVDLEVDGVVQERPRTQWSREDGS